MEIEPYLISPFMELDGRKSLTNTQKNDLMNFMKNLPDDDKPIIDNKHISLPRSYKYPATNSTMGIKTDAFWSSMNEEVRARLLNNVLNPAPATVPTATTTSSANKHEICRLLMVINDPANAFKYNMIMQPLNVHGIDRRGTLEAERDDGYAQLAEVFNDITVEYDHPVPGNGQGGAADAKYASIYRYVNTIDPNIDEERQRIRVRDSAWFKETFASAKRQLTLTMNNYMKSGEQNGDPSEADTEWIKCVEDSSEIYKFTSGLEWVMYAFTFMDKSMMDTFNKIIQNGAGYEDGDPVGTRGTTTTNKRRRRSDTDTPGSSITPEINLEPLEQIEREKLAHQQQVDHFRNAHQQQVDHFRNRIDSARGLAQIVPLEEFEVQARSSGIAFLMGLMNDPMPAVPAVVLNGPLPPRPLLQVNRNTMTPNNNITQV